MGKLLAGKTILVVDDETGVREVLSEEFRYAGATVLVARCGNEALQLYNENEIDVVVSDIRMPNGDGVFLLDSIRSDSAGIPIVMLISGYSDLTTDEAFARGANAIFTKPCDLDCLVSAVAKSLLPPIERWSKSVETMSDVVSAEFEAVMGEDIWVGRGGMFIAVATNALKISDLIKLTIHWTPNSVEPIVVVGIVRWIRSKDDSGHCPGLGVEIQRVSKSDAQLLLALIDSYQPFPYIPNSEVK